MAKKSAPTNEPPPAAEIRVSEKIAEAVHAAGGEKEAAISIFLRWLDDDHALFRATMIPFRASAVRSLMNQWYRDHREWIPAYASAATLPVPKDSPSEESGSESYAEGVVAPPRDVERRRAEMTLAGLRGLGEENVINLMDTWHLTTTDVYLGDATLEQITAEARYYRAQSQGFAKRWKFFDLIAARLGEHQRVRDALDNGALRALQAEAELAAAS